MERLIKVGMGQMLVVPGQPGENLLRARGMVKEAADKGCQIIVLPECLDLGWTYSGARAMAEPIPGKFSNDLADAARKNRMYVAAGLTEKDGDKLYNSAVFISPDGEILYKHRKINELDFAQALYTTGTSLGVVSTELGIVGMNICADNAPDSIELGHSLGVMGAEIILSPCAWAVARDHDNRVDPYGAMWIGTYSEISKKHGIPVIGVTNVGPVVGGEWDGWKCIGCSLAVDGNGDVIVQGPYGEEAEKLLVVEVTVGD